MSDHADPFEKRNHRQCRSSPHLTNHFAEVLLHLSAFHSFRTAIAAIVSTAFVVVLVVAIAVSLVLSHPAGVLALILWVDTLALQSKHASKTNVYAQALVQ